MRTRHENQLRLSPEGPQLGLDRPAPLEGRMPHPTCSGGSVIGCCILQQRGSDVVLYSKEVMAMPTLKIEFQDNETTPDRIAALAQEHGISPEDLIKRAINDYLGDYGLKDPPEGFRPKTLTELFIATGVYKPTD